ncbi:MAG: BspA family leucine-rich repeat surface protein [Flavobacteriaceae bacterium]|nr:BspA family leucine-rich repeat surface protein [Flavobacteriaceae bacterium]
MYTVATATSVGGEITPTQTIASGQTVSITATPQEHYQFQGWTGDCPIGSQEPTITWTVTTHCSLVAIFEKILYTIEATATAGGSVIGLETRRYAQGQAITLTAVPEENHQFTRWTTTSSVADHCPDLESLRIPTLRMVVQGPCALQAVFGTIPRTITTSIGAGGTIIETQTVAHGEEVTIAITLEAGYALHQWTGDCGVFSSDTTSITFPATRDCTLSAILQKTSHTIITEATSGGVIHGLTEAEQIQGKTVALMAEAEENHVFLTWATDGVACPTIMDPTNPKLSFIVEGPCVIEALFRKVHRTITTSVNEGGRITEAQTIGHGEEVSITVDIEKGYQHKAWTGDCGTFGSGETTIRFQATQDCQVQAILQKVEEDTTDPMNPDPVNPLPITKDCNGQQIPVNDPCPPPTPTTKECNGQQIPVNDPCPPPTPTTKLCHGQQIPVNDPCPPPTSTTKTCHGIPIPMDEECITPLLTQHANGVTIIINPEIPNPSRFVGQQATVDDIEYTLVDNALLKQRLKADPIHGQPPEAFCTTLVTDMSGLFTNQRFFNQYIGDWDTRRVTTMAYLFRNAVSFDQDISYWDVSQVTDMKALFQGARAFNQDISGWDVSGVTRMVSTFKGARAFNQDISGWDVSRVTDMSTLFQGATAFNQDLSGWDIRAVTSLGGTFEGALSFNQDLSGWDVSGVVSLVATFNGASSFNQDISGWDVGRVVAMSWLFSGATAFDQDLRGWDVRNVSDCRQAACGLPVDQRPAFTCNQSCLLARYANGVTVILHP